MQIPILSRFSIGRLPACRRTAVSVRANDVNSRARRLMAGIAPGKFLGIMQEG